MVNYQKIIIPVRPHPDVIAGIFLLKSFGNEQYPGISNAKIEIMQELPAGENGASLEAKGILALDIGGGKFDHHNGNENLSQLIAKDLGINEDPSIAKLLAYAQRDDKYGLGTISQDPLDKAFGLSGLIACLNRAIEDHEKVIEVVFPLLAAHCLEEGKRTKELPREFEKNLQDKKAEVFEITQEKKNLKVVMLESDNASMAGWLKSSIGVKADVVCQIKSSGHVNIMTRPLKKVDLRQLAILLRNEEAKTKGITLNYPLAELTKPGKLAEVPEWYYDNATNSILNGSVNPKGIAPTGIPLEKIKVLVREGLSKN
jgi:hypothetical protein